MMIYYNLKFKSNVKVYNTFKDDKRNIEYGLMDVVKSQQIENKPLNEKVTSIEKKESVIKENNSTLKKRAGRIFHF